MHESHTLLPLGIHLKKELVSMQMIAKAERKTSHGSSSLKYVVPALHNSVADTDRIITVDYIPQTNAYMTFVPPQTYNIFSLHFG